VGDFDKSSKNADARRRRRIHSADAAVALFPLVHVDLRFFLPPLAARELRVGRSVGIELAPAFPIASGGRNFGLLLRARIVRRSIIDKTAGGNTFLFKIVAPKLVRLPRARERPPESSIIITRDVA
jgi:hypothetical protein